MSFSRHKLEGLAFASACKNPCAVLITIVQDKEIQIGICMLAILSSFMWLKVCHKSRLAGMLECQSYDDVELENP